jgi:hypothetical protein
VPENQERVTSWKELLEGVSVPAGRQHRLVVLPCFEFVFDAGAPDERSEGAQLQLSASGYLMNVPLRDAEDLGDGLLAFTFPGVRRGLEYTLLLQTRDGTTTLLDAVKLDAFLDGIGNEDAPVSPLTVATVPVVSEPAGREHDRILGPQSPSEERFAGVHGMADPAGVMTA